MITLRRYGSDSTAVVNFEKSMVESYAFTTTMYKPSHQILDITYYTKPRRLTLFNPHNVKHTKTIKLNLLLQILTTEIVKIRIHR